MSTMNYVKLFEDGTTEATTNKPTFGEVSTTGDYFLNGLWYNSSNVVYPTQFTYLNNNEGKLLGVEVVGGVPVNLHYNEYAPKIVEHGLGKLLQVVTYGDSTTFNTTSTSYVDTGLGVTITPNSTSSKIKIEAYFTSTRNDGNADDYINARITRNGVDITGDIRCNYEKSTDNVATNVCIVEVDSPSTTSAIVYKVQMLRQNAGTGGTISRRAITATEIGA